MHFETLAYTWVYAHVDTHLSLRSIEHAYTHDETHAYACVYAHVGTRLPVRSIVCTGGRKKPVMTGAEKKAIYSPCVVLSVLLGVAGARSVNCGIPTKSIHSRCHPADTLSILDLQPVASPTQDLAEIPTEIYL